LELPEWALANSIVELHSLHLSMARSSSMLITFSDFKLHSSDQCGLHVWPPGLLVLGLLRLPAPFIVLPLAPPATVLLGLPAALA